MRGRKNVQRSTNYKARIERFFGCVSPTRLCIISEEASHQRETAVLTLGDFMALIDETYRQNKDQRRERSRALVTRRSNKGK